MTVWSIVTGISTILGLIGLIVYLIYKSQKNVIKSSNISVELLRELKKVDVSPEVLKKIPKNQRLDFLKNQTKLPQNVIDSVIVPSNSNKVKYSLLFLILMFFIAILSLFFWFQGSLEDNSVHGEEKEKIKNEIKVAILKTDNIAYVESIYTGFVQALVKNCEIPPIIYDKYGKKVNDTLIYEESIKTILEFDEFDYYVTIGTQASKALCNYFHSREELNSKSIIFLGVTDPIASKLIHKRKERTGKKNIAGVSYLGDIEPLAVEIHESFPNYQLYYMYSTQNPQDVIIADRLRKIILYDESILKIIKLNSEPKLSDFADSTGIYFSWYTFAKMFKTIEGIYIARKRNIVATTLENVRGNNLAIAAYIADEKDIGTKGAKLIWLNKVVGTPLGLVDIKVPNQYFCINCITLRNRRLPITKELLDNAHDNFEFECN